MKVFARNVFLCTGLIVSLLFLSGSAWSGDWDRSYYDAGFGGWKPIFYNGQLVGEPEQKDSSAALYGVLRFTPVAGELSEVRAWYPLDMNIEAGAWVHAEFFIQPDPGPGAANIRVFAEHEGKSTGLVAMGVRSGDEEEGWRRFIVHAQVNKPVDEIMAAVTLGWAEDAPQTENGFAVTRPRIWVTEEGPDHGEPLAEVQSWLDEVRVHLEQDSMDFDPEKHEGLWQTLVAHAAQVSTPEDLYAPSWAAVGSFFLPFDGGHSGISSPQTFDHRMASITYPADEDFGWASEMLTERIAHVSVPAFGGLDDDGLTAFAAAGHAALAAYQEEASCGWVVDLRRNSGGNMWGMLPGLQPLLGEGEVGAFVNRKGSRLRWLLTSSGATIEENEMSRSEPAGFTLTEVPVAVLTGRGTGSSGEATAVSFRGRPNTRSFGADTHGFADGVEHFTLSDGALLLLAAGRYSDRTGQVYGRKIPVDEPSDEPLEAAVEWLMGMCGE